MLVLAALLAVGVAPAAQAASPCAGLDTRVTPQRQQHAPIVAKVAGGAPPGVTITDFVQDGAWVFAHASFGDQEPAFFFEIEGARMRYVDLWAGFTIEEERAEDIAWARGIGAPAGLAACFAETAIGG